MNNQDLLSPFMPVWMPIAIRELGVSEVIGAKNNPRILEYHQATSLKASDDETSWCSSFTNWVMKQAGIKGSGLANARSWLNWGVGTEKPIWGAVTVLKRGSNPWQGHVGFLLYEGKSQIMLLGGNQGNKVSIAAFNKSDLLGYRLP
jgi:uncharacterized protein (TIGR02594 family)